MAESHREGRGSMSSVKISGEVKTVQLARKEDKESIKLMARIVIEFQPTAKGIQELQDLIAMQELPVNITISAQQMALSEAGKA